MKKRILLALSVVAMLVCVFAISVSAAVTTYDDAPEKTNITVSTDDVVVFDDGFTCPTGYIYKDQTDVPLVNGKASFASVCDFTYINGKTGKTYTYNNIVEFDIPEGVVSIGDFAAANNNVLKKVSIPKTVTEMGKCVFENATSLEECTFEHTKDSGLKILKDYMFSCTALKAISLPDCIEEISGERHFYKCTSLGAIYLPANLTKLSTVNGDKASFAQCTMYFVNDPFTYDSIPAKPDVYYFPDNLTTMAGELFKGCQNLNSYLVFGESLTNLENAWTFNGSNKVTIVFMGDMQKVHTSGNGPWNVEKIYFCNENDTSKDSFSITKDYAFSFCHAVDAVHNYAVKVSTLPTCTEEGVTGYECFCGKASDESTVVPALGHEENELLNKYFASVNGTLDYYSDMITEHSCTRCDAIIEGTEKGTALFTKKGYSYSENDATTFSYTIYVNQDAIKSYNEALLYGIVVSANANGAPIAYADGALTHDNKTIVVEFQSTDVAYSIITAKLTGVTATTELHLSAYCVDNGAVSYLGHSSVDKIAEIISYEALLEKYPDGKEE